MAETLPNSVRYIKNGNSRRWWKSAKESQQMHAGWKNIPPTLLLAANLEEIERLNSNGFGDRGAAKRDFDSLKILLDRPSQHIWITFEEGCMWWCTVHDGIQINPDGESQTHGHFWLNCDKKWSNRSLKDNLLTTSKLPGIVTKTAGFRATICKPEASATIRRIILDEPDAEVDEAAVARRNYEYAIAKLIRRLGWKDFELLIDLILSRSGWTRLEKLGGTKAHVDIEVENVATDEIAFVQVKSHATQAMLDNSVASFLSQRERYVRMIFAVHSPDSTLRAPADRGVAVWMGGDVASRVVKLGLGDWVATRL